MNNLQYIALSEAAARLEVAARAAGIDIWNEMQQIYKKIADSH